MKQSKTYYPCHCTIVPPHILEHMASASEAIIAEPTREAARLSLIQDNEVRSARANYTVDMTTIARSAAGEAAPQQASKKRSAMKSAAEEELGIMMPPAGTAGRAIFDANHSWGPPPPFALVRGEGDPVTLDQTVTNAYEAGGCVRDYYRNKLGRNSIDNLGLNQVHNVHVGVNWMNASWRSGVNQMFYGDGDGTIFVDFTKDADVIGHELTHGVTQFTAGLIYFSQSGALNEHFSDVFGTVIEQDMTGTADWLIGDGIMGPTLFGEALRSMKAPGTAYDNPLMGRDPQPDHMSNYYAGPADNQGVHINSGIPNKVFYLVATDSNVGTDKAALLWYTTLQKLWATAVFSDFARVLVESARLLTQSGQLRVGTTQTVRSALAEVGL